MAVVMVHGILDTGKVFRRLAADLEARGARCLCPSLSPSDGRDGLPDLSGKLDAAIREGVAAQEPIDLIGFSMGGLISRYWLQELGGHARVRRFFAISVPFAGSLWSWLMPSAGVRQMRPGSGFLAELEAGAGRLDGIEIVSYWTPFDLVIVPPSSSVWERAENIPLLVPCHPCMLWSRALREDIAARIGLSPGAGDRSR